MRIRPEIALPETITILNKLKKSDSATGLDVWYKRTLQNCVWNVEAVANQSGTTTSLGATIQCQIPQSNGGYLPYNEWKQAGNQSEHWTVSQNDYVVLGEVTEEVTAANIVKVLSSYEPNACKIQLFEDRTLKGGAIASGFLGQYSNYYYVEGV